MKTHVIFTDSLEKCGKHIINAQNFSPTLKMWLFYNTVMIFVQVVLVWSGSANQFSSGVLQPQWMPNLAGNLLENLATLV